MAYRPIPKRNRDTLILVSRSTNILAVYSVGDCVDVRDLGKRKLICQETGSRVNPQRLAQPAILLAAAAKNTWFGLTHSN